jgi:hypothetical protein
VKRLDAKTCVARFPFDEARGNFVVASLPLPFVQQALVRNRLDDHGRPPGLRAARSRWSIAW